MADLLGVQSGATLSACGRYRYRLWRTWDDRLPVTVWVMLNPSTADASQDDSTIRKCIGFARVNQCGGVMVVNLFAWRATDPKTLPAVADPVGPENDLHITMCVIRPELAKVVAAWGADRFARPRAAEVRTSLRGMRPMYCLGQTKDGSPRHPLYLPYSTPLQELG